MDRPTVSYKIINQFAFVETIKLHYFNLFVLNNGVNS